MTVTPKPTVDRTLHEPPRSVRRIPEPPGDDEDISQWKLVGRGSGVPGQKPLTSLVVRFNREQTDWIEDHCKRTGIDPFDLIRELVDDARTRDSA